MKVSEKPKIGRPRTFDREEAIESAMLVFWKHGYESTALSDLTKALNVNPPSIYGAFGNKKELFFEAVDRYRSKFVAAQHIIDEAKTVREAIFLTMRLAATVYTGADTPSGCLLATSAISCSIDASDVQEHLLKIRTDIEQKLAQRITQGVVNGELRKNIDCGALAAFYMSVMFGMSTLARDGASRQKLFEVVDLAMTTWPGSERPDCQKPR